MRRTLPGEMFSPAQKKLDVKRTKSEANVTPLRQQKDTTTVNTESRRPCKKTLLDITDRFRWFSGENKLTGNAVTRSLNSTPVRRSSIHTVQMIVWSNQLERIKRKTKSLRQRDAEIREKYKDIRNKAKRIFDRTDLDSDENFAPTPSKKIKTDLCIAKKQLEIEDLKFNKLKSGKKRPSTPRIVLKKSISASKVKAFNFGNFKDSKSASDITQCITVFSPTPKMNFNELSSPKLSPLLTVLKKGKRCTFC